MKIAGLFAGIGGIETGLREGLGEEAETVLLCEWWDPAKRVLAEHFPELEVSPDVRDLRALPQGTDVLAAGFPCQDLSQAGRTAGITGAQSGLVAHVFLLLEAVRASRQTLPWLMIENVPNMLTLDGGSAMSYLVEQLESLGYRWAYRVVDTRFTGLPQRRRRVIFLASTTMDPSSVLFADESGGFDEAIIEANAYGFYWTEGLRGLGWAVGAIPTLKGGSTIGIASPPAIWRPSADVEHCLVTPTLEDAEALQGFPRGWTDVDLGLQGARAKGTRWKLLGNAVTTKVAAWVGTRLNDPGTMELAHEPMRTHGAWPGAGFGANGQRFRVHASEFPKLMPYEPLDQVVNLEAANPLSARAAAGFSRRLHEGNLGKYPGFREAVHAYAEAAVARAVAGQSLQNA